LRVAGYGLRGAGCALRGTRYEVRVASYAVWGTDCAVRGASYGMRGSGFPSLPFQSEIKNRLYSVSTPINIYPGTRNAQRVTRHA
jgi:hypothetical protein